MKLELTNEQHQWIDQWLQLWGAWCQTGKIDKAMMNMIAKFMATVEPQAPSRPVCSDDDGLLIDAVIAYFHERRSLNNFHRDRVITFEQIAE
ncbi:antiterminator Q family protein, partial [Klebsiella pneumoniae]|uniref:antiterminator Q family protein n=1 Tax=Klebsiella pneumoniae TaxID=573 RepID=UPI0021BC236F